jgi:hypothetical protein
MLSGAEVSVEKPYSGQQHVWATRTVFAAELDFTHDQSASKVLISCYVDPRGKATVLHFSNGSETRQLYVDHTLIGYRQVAVVLPTSGLSSTFTITASGSNGQFLLDELKAESFGAALCERPQSTQILANYNGVQHDMIRSISLNGKELLAGEAFAADGYSLIAGKHTAAADDILLLDVQPEDADALYGYGVWIDTDRNGVFAPEERVALSSAQGALSLPLVTAGLHEGNYAVRVRMLDQRSNDLSDAYAGNTWGQSIDLFLQVSKDAGSAPCRCTQPDYFLDLSGKKLMSLDNVPAGMYIKVSENCTEKTLVAW